MASWFNTARNPKLGPIDARALYPMSVWILHMREWTFYVSVAGIVLFGAISWFGYTPEVTWRIVKRRLSGRTKKGATTINLRRWGRWM